jgi:hypothetical protein
VTQWPWPEAFRPIPDLPCPCGQVHELSAKTRVAYENVVGGLPPTVVITTRAGSWLVPRIFMAVHGLKASELPALAEQYGFESASAWFAGGAAVFDRAQSLDQRRPDRGEAVQHPTHLRARVPYRLANSF